MNRYYWPEVGRYITADPAGLTVDYALYSYALNNPLIYVDPLGLAACSLIQSYSTYHPVTITTQIIWGNWVRVHWQGVPLIATCWCFWEKNGVRKYTELGYYKTIEKYLCKEYCAKEWYETKENWKRKIKTWTEPLPTERKRTKGYMSAAGGPKPGEFPDIERGGSCVCPNPEGKGWWGDP
jgi:uncharacterized protein RhaS with RHS repeats